MRHWITSLNENQIILINHNQFSIAVLYPDLIKGTDCPTSFVRSSQVQHDY